jgi:hypothetical protein
MKNLLVILFFALPYWTFAQFSQVVKPKSGIVLRAAPNKGAEKLLNIPQGSAIEVGEKALATETIGGKKGAWRTCTFKGKSGYVFDGFLDDAAEEEEEVVEAVATTMTVVVDAPSGLILRAAPNKGSAKILSIKKGEKLVLDLKVAATETIEGKKGAWRKCTYGGKEGYVFDGFCKKI